MSQLEFREMQSAVKPRIVIHGGAGQIYRSNLSPSARYEYLSAITHILKSVYPRLNAGLPALDAAVAAVRMLEDNPLFNAGKGAVFTLDGTNELEASVMVSRGQYKRCAGVILLQHVKNPVLLAKEVLVRDDPSVERAARHNCLSGPYAEQLAAQWGLDIVDQKYFFTEKRWQQHLRDLERGESESMAAAGGISGQNNFTENHWFADEISKEGAAVEVQEVQADSEGKFNAAVEEYLPKGTVGCVVLDSSGVIAAATSTGGRTNKVPGRIGDTPTAGAGFWAEEWEVEPTSPSRVTNTVESLRQQITACWPVATTSRPAKTHRAVGLSGTGNGDFFLRLSVCHNIAARCRFGGKSLRAAAKEVCGPGGEIDKAGAGRGDSDGAVIGVDEEGVVVMEMNCGGCFRGTVDDDGRALVAAYADEEPAELKP
ncbi:L-asparaginase [Drechslerella dactyloides]|uniref:L-asparaginase n=1 Tax=Drechslerella dactyloides TaxID=74499 RepID=A0AAD6IQ12_DREDA|nr:L-asparaginase [Drechslerella dactyloides]